MPLDKWRGLLHHAELGALRAFLRFPLQTVPGVMSTDSHGCSPSPASDLLAREWRRVAEARRVVVKIGSNLLTGGGEALQREWITDRCAELALARQTGRQVVVVTSGAVAAGIPRLGLNRRPSSLREKQAAAAAGQGVLMRHYEEALTVHGIHAAQVLITREDVAHRRRYLNAHDTLTTLLDLGLVPVVNENDTVSVAEIKFGDNDTLAALVAGLVEADLLILLSDVAGLYEADPRHFPEARLLPLVHHVTPQVEALAGGTGSAVGSGGMVTKLKAAKKAARYGCRTVLANGFDAGVVTRILAGEPHGTLFLAEGDPISSRKRWIVNGLSSEGTLYLDDGAVSALHAGKSLLARGILAVEGRFDRGAAVYCRSPQGRNVAKGLVNYDAEQIRRLLGHHSSEFEALLGFLGAGEIIHRDDLVVLEA